MAKSRLGRKGFIWFSLPSQVREAESLEECCLLSCSACLQSHLPRSGTFLLLLFAVVSLLLLLFCFHSCVFPGAWERTLGFTVAEASSHSSVLPPLITLIFTHCLVCSHASFIVTGIKSSELILKWNPLWRRNEAKANKKWCSWNEHVAISAAA